MRHLLAFLLALAAPGWPSAGAFRASVVKVDITPADPQWRTSLVRLPVRFLRVSKEVVIWAAPLELF